METNRNCFFFFFLFEWKTCEPKCSTFTFSVQLFEIVQFSIWLFFLCSCNNRSVLKGKFSCVVIQFVVGSVFSQTSLWTQQNIKKEKTRHRGSWGVANLHTWRKTKKNLTFFVIASSFILDYCVNKWCYLFIVCYRQHKIKVTKNRNISHRNGINKQNKKYRINAFKTIFQKRTCFCCVKWVLIVRRSCNNSNNNIAFEFLFLSKRTNIKLVWLFYVLRERARACAYKIFLLLLSLWKCVHVFVLYVLTENNKKKKTNWNFSRAQCHRLVWQKQSHTFSIAK